MALRLLANPLAFLEEVTQQYGKVVGMVLGGERVVLVADSAVAEQVLITANSSVAKVQVLERCTHSDIVIISRPVMSFRSACTMGAITGLQNASDGTVLYIRLCNASQTQHQFLHLTFAGGDCLFPWQSIGWQWAAGV